MKEGVLAKLLHRVFHLLYRLDHYIVRVPREQHTQGGQQGRHYKRHEEGMHGSVLALL